MDTDRHAGRNYFMKTTTSTLIEYLSTQAKIMSKTRAPSADMMREAVERMQAMFDLLQEACFYADPANFHRSGYSLTVHWETAHRDIEYRDAPLYPTSEEAVEAELLKSVEPAQQ